MTTSPSWRHQPARLDDVGVGEPEGLAAVGRRPGPAAAPSRNGSGDDRAHQHPPSPHGATVAAAPFVAPGRPLAVRPPLRSMTGQPPVRSVTTSPRKGRPMSRLDKQAIVAGPGYSRWLIPPAALAVHLSIGQVYAFSVFKNSLVASFDTSLTAIGWVFSLAIVMLGPLRRRARHLGRAVRPAQGDARRRPVLGRRLHGRLGRHRDRPALAALPRLRRHRRHRARHRLHLPGLDADQVVPRPSGPGHRHGDHGLRRRRADRLAALQQADGASTTPTSSSTEPGAVASASALAQTFVTLGIVYTVFMLIGAALVRVPPGHGDDSTAEHSPGTNGALVRASQAIRTPAVLVPVGRAVLQRHRGHRHPRAGRADDPGLLPRERRQLRLGGRRRRVRRRALAGQHARPLRLVEPVRPHRAQADLRHVPRRRARALPAARALRQQLDGRLRGPGRRDHLLLRRRLRDRPGLPQGPLRHPRGRRHPRPPAHRLGGRRRRRARSSSTASSTASASRATSSRPTTGPRC